MAIVVTDPNGGERFYVDRVHAIAWTDSTSQNVKIELSLNNGSSWSEIEDSTASVNGSNSYNYTPVVGDVSDECLVRITSTTNGADTDVSDAVFEILSPTIVVLAPSDAATYRKGDLVGVRWSNTASHVTAVNILLSTDSGATFPQTIASNVPVAQGYSGYLWNTPNDTIPGASTSYANCRIKVVSTAAGDTNNFDTSDNNFTVQNADTLPSSAYAEGASNPHDDYPQRYEAMARVAGEKAVENDEAVMKGQIYGAGDGSGTGNIISTRNSDTGTATSNDIIFDTVRDIPRTLHGLVVLSTLDSGYTTSQGKFGDHYYADIAHNWNLGAGDNAYKVNVHTHNKFVTSMDSLYDAEVEHIDGNTIRLHMVRKGAAFVTQQSKDQVTITHSNTFYFMLLETVEGTF